MFVSGKKSSNGKVLFDVCKQFNPNTHFVSSVEELNMDLFKTGDKIGICGATSTPMWLMNKVKSVLESY